MSKPYIILELRKLAAIEPMNSVWPRDQMIKAADKIEETLSRLDSLQSEYSEAIDLLRKSDDANESLLSRLDTVEKLSGIKTGTISQQDELLNQHSERLAEYESRLGEIHQLCLVSGIQSILKTKFAIIDEIKRLSDSPVEGQKL